VGEQSHRSDPRILGRRTLERDHRHLAELLRPGMAVLDIGCGTGSITAGIAKKVGSTGSVVGLDRDDSLLAIARSNNPNGNLRFEMGDVLALPFENEFDIVTAARTLQWVADPTGALAGMKRAAKRGGRIVVLDYDHDFHTWQPSAPAEFGRFYRAFLDWRSDRGWSNQMASQLPGLFESTGLRDIAVHDCDEITGRGDELWLQTIESVGAAIEAAGYIRREELASVAASYRNFIQSELMRQVLRMKTVEGVVP
jgi:SAM-dependent methyltransferase